MKPLTPKKRTKRTMLTAKLLAISAVDLPAQEGALAVLVKRDNTETHMTPELCLKAARDVVAGNPNVSVPDVQTIDSAIDALAKSKGATTSAEAGALLRTDSDLRALYNLRHVAENVAMTKQARQDIELSCKGRQKSLPLGGRQAVEEKMDSLAVESVQPGESVEQSYARLLRESDEMRELAQSLRILSQPGV